MTRGDGNANVGGIGILGMVGATSGTGADGKLVATGVLLGGVGEDAMMKMEAKGHKCATDRCGIREFEKERLGVMGVSKRTLGERSIARHGQA